MRRAIIATYVMIAAAAGVGCGKSPEERGREQAEAEAKRDEAADRALAPEAPKKVVSVDAAVPADAPLREPTTPAEIETARKQAMLDNRTKDVIRYCEMAKYTEKSDPQARLGCALAACREKDVDKARGWAGALPKDLKAIAKKTCLSLQIPL